MGRSPKDSYNLVVLEVGVDLAVPSLRIESEDAAAQGYGLVRAPPRDPPPACHLRPEKTFL
jgi:hypothetical protein